MHRSTKKKGEPWLKVCGELANDASKRFTLAEKNPVTSDVTSTTGFGEGIRKRGYGAGEESIEVTISNGATWTHFEFTAGVIQAWFGCSARHGIKV
jgi:hypothetical protein